MKSMKRIGMGLVLATTAMVTTPAMAEVSGSLGVSSEYIFRGLPSSDGGAQVWGALDWSSGPLYTGMWLSNVGSQGKGTEVDVYGGFTSGIFDVGAIAYLFPGDQELSSQPGVGSHGNLTEVYAGLNSGPFSGYVWYGLGADNAEDDEYVYIEGNVELPVSDKASIGLHLGVTSFLGDAVDDNDEIIDVAATMNFGNFWVGVSLIPEYDDAAGNEVTEFERPRFNAGYTWTFDDVL